MKAGKKGLLCLLLLVLIGCSDLSPAAPPSTNTNVEPPLATSTLPTQEATVSDTSGAIVGTLVDENGEPITDLGVFLATLHPGPTPDSNIISFSLNSAKRGLTDQQGRFVIGDVEAGSYSLAILTPVQTSLIPEPGGEQDSAIKVDVKAGQVTDLGTLKMKRPR